MSAGSKSGPVTGGTQPGSNQFNDGYFQSGSNSNFQTPNNQPGFGANFGPGSGFPSQQPGMTNPNVSMGMPVQRPFDPINDPAVAYSDGTTPGGKSGPSPGFRSLGNFIRGLPPMQPTGQASTTGPLNAGFNPTQATQQNPNVSIGMPVQQQPLRGDFKLPDNFVDMPRIGMPVQQPGQIVARPRPGMGIGMPVQRPGNRFIPINAPGRRQGLGG